MIESNEIYTETNHESIVRTKKHMHDKPPPLFIKIKTFILYSILGNAYTR